MHLSSLLSPAAHPFRPRAVARLAWAAWLILWLTEAAPAQSAFLEVPERLFQQGRYEAALHGYRALMALRPAWPLPYARAGRCLIALGRLEEAIQLLSRAAEKSWADAELLAVLGEAHYRQALCTADPSGRGLHLTEAGMAFEKAVEKDPRHHVARYYLARIRLSGDPPRGAEAEKLLREALRLAPNQPDYHFRLGEALEVEGRYAEAAAAYARAAELAAGNPRFRDYVREAWARVGRAWGRGGEREQALTAFRRAVAMAPENADTYQRIWEAFGREGAYADGLAVVEALAREHPDSPLPPYYAGYFYRGLRKSREARAAFARVVANPRGKHFPAAWAFLANYLYWEDRDDRRAMQCAVQALKLDRQNRRALETLQLIVGRHLDRRNLDLAEEAAWWVVRFRPQSAPDWSNLGLVLRERGRYRDAWEAYRKALALAPENPQILNDAAVVLQFHSLGVVDPLEEARKLYERALALDPKNVDVLTNLGMVLAAKGQLAEARRYLERALAIRPGWGIAQRELNKVKRRLSASSEEGSSPRGRKGSEGKS